MVLFLLVPALLGAAAIASSRAERHVRCSRARRSNEVAWPCSVMGASRASCGTFQVSLGSFSGPLLGVSKKGRRKVRSPEAYFMKVTFNGESTRSSVVAHNTGINTLELAWGPSSPPISFSIPCDAAGKPTTSDLILELYGCRQGCLTGRIKNCTLLGVANVELRQHLVGATRTVTAVFWASESGRICHGRRRVVTADGGSGLGQMEVGISVMAPGVLQPGGSALAGADAMETDQYEYDTSRVDEDSAKGDLVSEEGYRPAAVYGPDGATWVAERREGE